MALKAVTRARDEGPFFLVDALRVQGMIMARQRRYEQSQRSFAESRELAGSMPVPYAEGRVLFEMSRMLSEQGEPEPARLRLQEALSIFQRLGAAKDVERTEQILASSV
jgi:hypothetical protein